MRALLNYQFESAKVKESILTIIKKNSESEILWNEAGILIYEGEI